MKTAKKVILLILCAALMVSASVMGTLAYLQMATQTVTNTMTLGEVKITLHEYKIDDATGKKTDIKTTDGIAGIKLIPGREIEKNPVITVAANSEDCYLFVKVENTLSEYITIDWDTTKWQQIEDTDFWMYIVGKVTAEDVVSVFETITCNTAVESGADLTDKSIAITAYAIQAEGFDSKDTIVENLEDAWNASGFATANP